MCDIVIKEDCRNHVRGRRRTIYLTRIDTFLQWQKATDKLPLGRKPQVFANTISTNSRLSVRSICRQLNNVRLYAKNINYNVIHHQDTIIGKNYLRERKILDRFNYINKESCSSTNPASPSTASPDKISYGETKEIITIIWISEKWITMVEK